MKKVMVGMSGGVDSSTVAAILCEKGYEVSGVTLDLLPGNSDACNDAREVCKALGIPHNTLNLKEQFNTEIMDYFAFQYQNGYTPNPCVMCNKKIKFGFMLKYALEKGNDFIATGHYANVFYDSMLKRWLLKKSNSVKDQSYFLYGLTQHQLSHSMFPLGDYPKEYVRELAKKYNLAVHKKQESQDICFAAGLSPAQFVMKHTAKVLPSGNFESESGKILGRHKGIAGYTVGQRKGLGISALHPLYVLSIDACKNRIILGEKESGLHSCIKVKDANFISSKSPVFPLDAKVKIRYRAPAVSCKIIFKSEGILEVKLLTPVYFPAPGQSAVFYDENGLVIGGGTIM